MTAPCGSSSEREDKLEAMLVAATSALRDAFAEGEAAALRNLHAHQNPYPDHSHTNRFWRAGFASTNIPDG